MSDLKDYDVRARKKVTIVPSSIKVWKYAKKGTYRVSGHSRDGHKLSLFVSEDKALKLAREHGGIHRA